MSDINALTIEEAVERSRLSRAGIYRAIGEGRLVARKIGRRTIILPDDLKSFLDNLPPAQIGPSRAKAA